MAPARNKLPTATLALVILALLARPARATGRTGANQPLPAPVLVAPLNYDSKGLRYMLTLELGSARQPVALVLDTGSASIFTDGFDTAASSTAVGSGVSSILGYGSAPVRGSTFFKDSFAIAGAAPGPTPGAPSLLSVPAYPWLAVLSYRPHTDPPSNASQGLVGFAPPGGLTGGRGSYADLSSATGALCPAAHNTSLRPCSNTPSVFGVLVQSGALPAANNMFSLYIARDPADNGGVGAGQLLLGGADPSLAAGPFVTTPLQPNLWRTDFATGRHVFVFWQFNPRSISVLGSDGSSTTLCRQADAASSKACTVIADTGYSSLVVGDPGTRSALQAALAPATGPGACATALQVELPLTTASSSSRFGVLTIPLTKDGSGDCATPANRVLDASLVTAPSTKFVTAGVLPRQWFVFGQPLLRQLYTVFDYTAFGGQGGLHFAPAAKPGPL